MKSALLYLQLTSLRNKVRVLVQKLRSPKYLLSLLVGLCYLYFTFGLSLGRSGASPSPTHLLEQLSPSLLALQEPLMALTLLLLLAFLWVFPGERAILHFSEAEISFLFAAPVRRTTLIHYKLLKSQLSILLTSVIFTLLFRLGTPWLAWLHLLGWWLVLSCLQLHRVGASFTLQRLGDLGLALWLRRLLLALLLGSLVAWLSYSFLNHNPSADPALGLSDKLLAFLNSQPVASLLLPLRLALRPLCAHSLAEFLASLPAALLILALHYLWVLRSQVSFEEASIEAEQRRLHLQTRHTKGATRLAPSKPRRLPFSLSASGPIPVAFLWKGLLTAGNFFHPRSLMALVLVLWLLLWQLTLLPGFDHLRQVLSFLCFMAALWTLAFGAMMTRRGVPQLRERMDVLKSIPVRGWQIVLGEMLTPIYLITVIEWGLMGGFLVTYQPRPNLSELTACLVGPGLYGIALLAPLIIGLMCSIQFAAFLLFPAWVTSVSSRSAGIEVLGQRLIFAFGYLLTFLLTLLPAIVLTGIPFVLLFIAFDSPLPAVLVSTVVAILILLAELWVVVWWLGDRYEHFDLSAESPQG